MANMMKMMKQAADMQKNMQKMQAEMAEKTVEFSAGGGAVTVTARGDITVQSIKIDPKVVDPEDIEMLEDLVLAGVDGALKQAQEMVNEEMSKLTKGLNIPGLGM
jgi:DNA-binding YbaB/EbfC family protein